MTIRFRGGMTLRHIAFSLDIPVRWQDAADGGDPRRVWLQARRPACS